MRTFTIQEAARRLNVSEKTVRRWVHENKIASSKHEGRYIFTEDDINAYKEAHKPPFEEEEETVSARLSAIEKRLETIEQLLRRLTASNQPKVLRPPKAEYTAKTPSDTTSTGGTLPDGWVAIADLIQQYDAKETTVMRHMRTYLKPGKWKTPGGKTVKYALDPEGQRKFLEEFGLQS